MPHSGGGGGHGGGHGGGGHGGSHHVGERTTPFRDSKKYCYTSRSTGHVVHFYSDRQLVPLTPDEISEKRRKIVKRTLITWLIFGLFFLITDARVPSRLDDTGIKIYINDELNVIDEAQILPILQEYKERTGITPAIVTIANKTWQTNSKSLESYAYMYYIRNLVSEKYAMIIYSTNPDNHSYNEWYFETMLGDDTYGILDNREMDRLANVLQKNFENEQTSVTQSIIDALQESMNHCMSVRLPITKVCILLAFVGIFIFTKCVTIGKVVKPNLPGYQGEPITLEREPTPSYQYIPTKTIGQAHTCNYCGKSFIIKSEEDSDFCKSEMNSNSYIL